MSELFQEKWVKWVALSTTVLAVCAAISSLKGGGYSTRIQLSTTLENSKWSYYQAKSIKQNMMQSQRDLFALYAFKESDPEAKKMIDGKLKQCEAEVARYEKEKEQIKTEAESIAREQDVLKKHAGNFGIAVMFLQIAIMLSSVGTLLKRREVWITGLAIGVFGLVYMANGFFLVF
ncbi:MAG: DUF4337 domain-containing protein [Deltaproteobacteria bacterium]